MNTRQFFSNINAIKGGYAPSKVQDAFDNLLMISGSIFITAIVLLGIIFPLQLGAIILVFLSLYLSFRVINSTVTISKYLIKGE